MIVINGSTGLTLPNGNVITSATVSANNGTAALPNYTGTDTDTGMWFPDVNAVAISTAGVERMRIDSSGNITGATISAPVLTGLVDISAASAGQIKFPATQNTSSDANTLDDYEEGTWTPNVIHSGSNNSTWPAGGKNGYYTKVGRLVTAWFVCDAGNSGTSGTTLQLTGLPFALGTITGTLTFGIWSTNGTIKNGGLTINTTGATTMSMFNGGGPITEQQTYASGCVTYFV